MFASSSGTYKDREEAMAKARKRAKVNGHRLGRFCRLRSFYSRIHGVNLGQMTASCPCGVGVTVRWLPNGRALRLTGAAVDTKCTI